MKCLSIRWICSLAIGTWSVVFASPVVAQSDDNQFEVMTRGPVHEAFAAPLTINPEPGLVVANQPPQDIEEIPPEMKPEGDVVWIPGYWAWDEGATDFVWISGVWRLPPPNTVWTPGYWEAVDGGSQWMAGFWNDPAAEQIEYYPDPPASLEEGPSSPTPGDDHFWIPGCWQWRDRYVWQTGYWAPFQSGWVWTAAHYQWTPAGCIFIPGRWDFPVQERGWLFAPVAYRQPIYLQASYSYTPRVLVNLSLFTTHLFSYPRYQHYYTGNYYDLRYQTVGLKPWYSYRDRGFGYDPLFSYSEAFNRRRNPNWSRDLGRRYDFYRQNTTARPPNTFRALQQVVQSGGTNINVQNVNVATTINQFVSNRSNKFAPLDDDRRERFRAVTNDYRSFSRDRATRETRTAEGRGDRTARLKTGPIKVALPKHSQAKQDAFRDQFANRNQRTSDPGRDRAASQTTQPGGKARQGPEAQPRSDIPDNATASDRQPGRGAQDRATEAREKPFQRLNKEPKVRPNKAASGDTADDPGRQTREQSEQARGRTGQEQDSTQLTPGVDASGRRANQKQERGRGREVSQPATPPDQGEGVDRIRKERVKVAKPVQLPSMPADAQPNNEDANPRQREQAVKGSRRQGDNPSSRVPGANRGEAPIQQQERIQKQQPGQPAGQLETPRSGRRPQGMPDSSAVQPNPNEPIGRRQAGEQRPAARGPRQQPPASPQPPALPNGADRSRGDPRPSGAQREAAERFRRTQDYVPRDAQIGPQIAPTPQAQVPQGLNRARGNFDGDGGRGDALEQSPRAQQNGARRAQSQTTPPPAAQRPPEARRGRGNDGRLNPQAAATDRALKAQDRAPLIADEGGEGDRVKDK